MPTFCTPDSVVRALDAVANRHRWPDTSQVSALAARVAKVSALYNDPDQAPRASDVDPAARMLFFLPRDLPKSAEAVRDLLAGGHLPDRPLQVLDLGAGLGATWLGLHLAASRAGLPGVGRVRMVDTDGRALDLAREIAAAVAPQVEVGTRVGSVADGLAEAGQGWDVVLFGQVLSELDRERAATERVDRHLAHLRRALQVATEAGTVVVIEPALSPRARHLQAVRDAWIARGGRVFGPCLHHAACPLLAHPRDWCHDDRPTTLPDALIPVARAAGLRHERTTFSWLILRADAVSPGGPPLRVVGAPPRQKGRRELWLCGSFADGGGGRKLFRQDRDTRPDEGWMDAVRGDRVTLEPVPTLADSGRIPADTRVRVGP